MKNKPQKGKNKKEGGATKFRGLKTKDSPGDVVLMHQGTRTAKSS